jgi:hypothetical protein
MKEATSFCEQKEAKKLYDTGAGARAPALPHAQARLTKVFARFFQKAPLAFSLT